MTSELPQPSGAGASFASTHWSLVLAAGDPDSPQSHAALASLCHTYWYPLYAYVRRQGHQPADAQDLTQGFFTRVMERDYLASVAPEKGRFRAFLLACLRHFLANERDRADSLKRGGGRHHFSMDFSVAENRYAAEPAHMLTAEKLFDRRWALTLLDEVLLRLRAEHAADGKDTVFDSLKDFLTGENRGRPYEELSQALNMSTGALKVAIHRLRKRYRELLREEIGRTIHDPNGVEDEIQCLFRALS